MRIAFCGKGGSGKTSMASLFIRYLDGQGDQVLAIDGDINQHLGEALNIEPNALEKLPRLGNQMMVMKEYIRGNNAKIISAGHMIESTPAGNGSNFVRFNSVDPVTETFMIKQGNVRFMAVGGHEEHDVGATCYHKFTGAEGLFLNHLLDEKDEFVIGDMCAGADPFASSGLATRYDAIYLVLEPTLKSLAVYDQAMKYTVPWGIPICVIANKITSPEDVAFIEKHTGVKSMAVFSNLSIMRDFEKGLPYDVKNIDAQTLESLNKMRDMALSLPERDWDKYMKTGLEFHTRASESWANACYGANLVDQYDPGFHYKGLYQSARKAA